MAVRIDGEDGTQTELKYLTNKATEGYEIHELAGFRSEGGGKLPELSLHLLVHKIPGLI